MGREQKDKKAFSARPEKKPARDPVFRSARTYGNASDAGKALKDPSQPPPFSMPSKLLI